MTRHQLVSERSCNEQECVVVVVLVAPMGYRKAQDSEHGIDGAAGMSITTIDTKTGEVKQISQEQLVDLLKEAAQKGSDQDQQDPMPISVEQLQQILESVPQGDGDDPRVIQG